MMLKWYKGHQFQGFRNLRKMWTINAKMAPRKSETEPKMEPKSMKRWRGGEERRGKGEERRGQERKGEERRGKESEDRKGEERKSLWAIRRLLSHSALGGGGLPNLKGGDLRPGSLAAGFLFSFWYRFLMCAWFWLTKFADLPKAPSAKHKTQCR